MVRPIASCSEEGREAMTTDIAIPSGIFKVCGQVHLDNVTLIRRIDDMAVDLDRYDDVAVNSLRLSLEAIRKQVDGFSFWQHHRSTGRPAYEERTFLVPFLVQQLLGMTFRETEGILSMLRTYYRLDGIPDHSTLSRSPAGRWSIDLERFFQYVLAALPERGAVVATDATGYSGRKRGWRETKHGQREVEDWVKVHAAIEVDELLVLSYQLTAAKCDDSQKFADHSG